MKIIISPAKNIRTDRDFIGPQSTPVFLAEAQILHGYLRGLAYEELKAILHCNDAIAALNFERYRNMNFQNGLTAALLAYDGIQYRYMAPHVFSNGEFAYLQNHLAILSGFYGLLRPFDGIVPHRLEIGAKFQTPFCKSLYGFWAEKLYCGLADKTIVNLASREYAKAVTAYRKPDTRIVTCIFGEKVGRKTVEKGVYVKMARGEMVRYMAENRVENPESLKNFKGLGYVFSNSLSDDENYFFIRNERKLNT